MFNYMTKRKRQQQHFDKTKITLTKAGQTYNVYDRIQANREDTEIYPTLEKYGCIDKLSFDYTKTFNDFTDFPSDLRNIKDTQIKAQQMFENLPLETRARFNNNLQTFINEGKSYCENLIKADTEKTKKNLAEFKKNHTTTTTGETINEQK